MTGSHAAPAPRASRGARIAKAAAAVTLVALVLTLLAFGDDIFGAGGDDPDESRAGQSLSPEDLEVLRPAVTEAATDVLTTWARPGARYRDWWRSLRPLLSAGAREAYAFTDPDQLPHLGDPEPVDAAVHGLGRQATVYFDTDEGRFGVDLSRKGGKWLANRVIFPGGESMFG